MSASAIRFTNGELVECGVDYLTLTSTTDHEATRLATKAFGLKLENAREGNQEKPWSMMGYKGFQCGGIQWGEREDSVIVRLSGPSAYWNWWDFYQECSHATRVDLQVTVRVDQPTNSAVLFHYRQTRKFWTKRKDGPRLTHIHDTDGGATLYIGSRQSNLYFRIYAKDKESQSPLYARCLRYEGEFKDCVARQLLAQIVDSSSGNLEIAGYLVALLRDRGCLPLIAREGWERTLIRSPVSRTDCERKLAWIRASVRPTIRYLLDHADTLELIDCLGLSASEVIEWAELLQTIRNGG